jgi:hypothetical protein
MYRLQHKRDGVTAYGTHKNTNYIPKGWMKVNKTVLCHAYKFQTQIFSAIFQVDCGVFPFSVDKHDYSGHCPVYQARRPLNFQTMDQSPSSGRLGTGTGKLLWWMVWKETLYHCKRTDNAKNISHVHCDTSGSFKLEWWPCDFRPICFLLLQVRSDPHNCQDVGNDAPCHMSIQHARPHGV